jgi:hypothetical protein
VSVRFAGKKRVHDAGILLLDAQPEPPEHRHQGPAIKFYKHPLGSLLEWHTPYHKGLQNFIC